MWQSKSRKDSKTGSVHCTELRQVSDFHLKRVECEIRPLAGEASDAQVKAQLILNDLSEKGVALYGEVQLAVGSLVQIEIRYPESLSVKARVSWCQTLTTAGRVINSHRPSFRIGLLFELETPEDQERLRILSEKLKSTYPGSDLTDPPYAA